MHPAIKAAIVAAARLTPTVEICGFIVRSTTGEPALLPCANVAARPEEAFEISDSDQIAALQLGQDNVLGLYHSHPTRPGFSAGGPGHESDLAYAETIALPMYLYTVATDTWHDYTPASYTPPLEGRGWATGFTDCYGLLRDYSRSHWGHHMADYDRDGDSNQRDLILSRLGAEGFVEVPLAAARLDDVLMFKSRRLLANHFGILVGPSVMLHHHEGGLSCRETVDDRWLSRLTNVYRLADRRA